MTKVKASSKLRPVPARRGEPLLQVDNLTKYFPITQGIIFQKEVARVHAVEDVSFQLFPGETLGLVGESGCGKSTLARLILRLLEPTAGEVLFEGENILGHDRKQMLTVRRNMQIVFQDP